MRMCNSYIYIYIYITQRKINEGERRPLEGGPLPEPATRRGDRRGHAPHAFIIYIYIYIYI